MKGLPRPFLLSALLLLALAMQSLVAAGSGESPFRNVSAFEMTRWLPTRPADARIRYADQSPLQYGDLWLPASAPPAGGRPVIVFLHGGAWRAEWSKDYSSPFVEQLVAHGFAVWELEFRRIGNRGGGYPGTFLDVGAGADHLRKLKEEHALDLTRVVAVGHSSGGHLALWLAGRHRIASDSALHQADPLPLAGVVSLAGVNDLRESLTKGGRTDVLTLLDVETAEAAGPRFEETDPGRLLPLGIPQVLLLGSQDSTWRIEMTRNYAARARAAGDRVTLEISDGANHFDVVDPRGPFPQRVTSAASKILE